jgi:hypothetical protein
MAFSFPPKPDDQLREEPRIIFGPGHHLQERYDDPEVQGGKIAFIAFKQNRVQKPPNYLDRMQSRYLKQVAYNDRVIEAENKLRHYALQGQVRLSPRFQGNRLPRRQDRHIS